MNNIFEKATRDKIRFNFKGLCTVEDLWDMNLTALDSMYIDLTSELDSTRGSSLLGKTNKKDTETILKTEIIKYIVNVKLDEKEKRDNELKRKEEKQKIMSLIAEKRDESLRNKTEEELVAMLNTLE